MSPHACMHIALVGSFHVRITHLSMRQLITAKGVFFLGGGGKLKSLGGGGGEASPLPPPLDRTLP